tara:strand:+ start:153 stop:440 length:288 start_codon:yes stop_codon:yes gene_type:complete
MTATLTKTESGWMDAQLSRQGVLLTDSAGQPFPQLLRWGTAVELCEALGAGEWAFRSLVESGAIARETFGRRRKRAYYRRDAIVLALLNHGGDHD